MFGPLAVEGGRQRLPEAGRGQGQVEGGEVLQREQPAARRQVERLGRALAGAEHAFAHPVVFGADHRTGEERGAPVVGGEDRDLRRGAVGERRRLGSLEQHVAVARRFAPFFPEHVGGGRGDLLEGIRRFAVPGRAAGDHVWKAVQGRAREGVEVDRAVGVAGVEGLLEVLRDVLVGELDQGDVGVGAEQVVGGVAVLAGVEDRLAVDDRQEGAQLRVVSGRPDRSVAQRQEGRVQRAGDEDDSERRPGHAQHGPGRWAEPGEQRPDRDQHRQRRADHQRLGLRVVAAERHRDQVEGEAGGEGERHREVAPADPPDRADRDRQQPDRAGEPREVGAAGGEEPVVGGGPDAERLDRRDGPVGVAARDLVEAAAEAEGADQGEDAEPGEGEERRAASAAARGRGPAPAARARCARRAGSAPRGPGSRPARRGRRSCRRRRRRRRGRGRGGAGAAVTSVPPAPRPDRGAPAPWRARRAPRRSP